ncbi:hypothetical protein [Pollutibacter soli]|uniref:hypothetical protein n=1 Tax=Pollutibacter soli TaxID=3034157 RepID=UPI003013F20F
MKKSSILISALGFVSSVAVAQTAKFGMPEEMLQKRTSAIENAVGALNNSYLVVESDYGKASDFNNNIRTNIRKYAINNLGNKGTVYLNPLVADGLDEDKIIFTDVFQWGNRVAGFYTIKGKSTKKSFPVYARFFDGNLKPIGKTAIDIGDFTHGQSSGGTIWQSGTIINGRNKLAVRDEFRFRICSDSSKLVMIMHDGEKDGYNLILRLFDKDLNKLNEVKASVPIREKGATLSDFELGNNGIVYVLTRTPKSRADRKEAKEDDNFNFEMHAINTADGKVQTKEIGAPGKSMLKPSFTLDAKERPTVISMYSDNNRNKDAGGHGIYTAKFDPHTLAITVQDQQDFSNEMLLKEIGEKDIKKGRGIRSASLAKITRRSDGGIYALGQSVSTVVVSRGTTGAMNSYYTEYGMTVFCYIDTEGKVRWSRAIDNSSMNQEALTTSAGAIALYRENKLFVGTLADNGLKKKELKQGFRFNSYDDSGKEVQGKFIEFSEDLQEFAVIPQSFFNTSDNTIMACLYHGFERGHKEMEVAVMQVKF